MSISSWPSAGSDILQKRRYCKRLRSTISMKVKFLSGGRCLSHRQNKVPSAVCLWGQGLGRSAPPDQRREPGSIDPHKGASLNRRCAGGPPHAADEQRRPLNFDARRGTWKRPRSCKSPWRGPVSTTANSGCQFCSGGVATPADAALMMQLGAEGVFVGSGIFSLEIQKKGPLPC